MGLMESTPINSLGVLSGVSPLADVPNYKYLVTVFHKHGHPLRERPSNPVQVELRNMYEGICIGGPDHFPAIKILCTI
jgi:hypothetical protein